MENTDDNSIHLISDLETARRLFREFRNATKDSPNQFASFEKMRDLALRIIKGGDLGATTEAVELIALWGVTLPPISMEPAWPVLLECFRSFYSEDRLRKLQAASSSWGQLDRATRHLTFQRRDLLLTLARAMRDTRCEEGKKEILTACDILKGNPLGDHLREIIEEQPWRSGST